MLNQLPLVRMSGENNNELYVASRLISNLKEEHGSAPILDQDFDRQDGAWRHGAIAPQSMACAIQHVISVLNPPPKEAQLHTAQTPLEVYDAHTIVGVKTIRFQKGSWTVSEAVDFLRENFPCSRVVINIRSNVQDQVNSISKTFGENLSKDATADATMKRVHKMNDFLLDLGEVLGKDIAKVIDMSEWVQDVDVINDVIDWLGYENCAFKQILHENSPGDKGDGLGRDHETDTGLDESCRYPFP
jgi:hypothetical protein